MPGYDIYERQQGEQLVVTAMADNQLFIQISNDQQGVFPAIALFFRERAALEEMFAIIKRRVSPDELADESAAVRYQPQGDQYMVHAAVGASTPKFRWKICGDTRFSAENVYSFLEWVNKSILAPCLILAYLEAGRVNLYGDIIWEIDKIESCLPDMSMSQTGGIIMSGKNWF